MLFYVVYLIGYWGCQLVPARISYWFARKGGDWYCARMPQSERDAVRANLSVILQTDHISDDQVRDVFRNSRCISSISSGSAV